MSAAGIIVYRIIDKEPKFLGLIALDLDQERCKGIYDIPKGVIEKNEKVLDAAKRECFEECGLSPEIIAGPFRSGKITVWLGESSKYEEVKIYKNPLTGIIEHQGYVWKSPEYIRKNCLNYLKPHLEWAEKEILNHLRGEKNEKN